MNPEQRAPLLALVGGGTGGHIFPAVAIAQVWKARGGQLIFIGNPKSIEARVTAELGFEFHSFQTRRLKNAGGLERARTLLGLPVNLLKAVQLLRRLRPQVVLGVGGYVSGPVLLAAAALRLPCAVAEQNARAGLSNRILGRFVQRVYSAFPQIEAQMPPGKVRLLGNPLRREVLAQAERARPAGRGRRVFVLGGSQGALALNQHLPAVLSTLSQEFPDLQVLHQAGRGKEEPVKAAYAAAAFPKARVEAFIDEIAQEMEAADLLVARAGATTVAELACIGRPALLIPFPYAADDHQAANAQALVDLGAAQMLREEALKEQLPGVLKRLLNDQEGLAEMGRRARRLARPKAAEEIVEDLWNLS